MKVALVTLGTRGDVQPFAALALALRDLGHEATIVTNRNHAEFLARLDLPHVPMACDTAELYGSDEGKALLANGRTAGLVKRGNAWFSRVRGTIEQAVDEGTIGADVVVSGFLVDDIAQAFAESRGQRFVLSHFAPWAPMRALPSILLAQRSLGPLNGLTHALAETLAYGPKAGAESALRVRLGLRDVTKSCLHRHFAGQGLFLGGWSPALFAKPAEWPVSAHVTGPWRLPQSARQNLGEAGLPRELKAWIEKGEAPVFLSLGSMPVPDPVRLITMARQAARAAGQRVLIGAGWSDLAHGPVSDEVLVWRPGVNHDQLFPLCRGVIHHGGAGSTDSALRSGKPSHAITMFADGPFWGGRLRALKVGGGTVWPKLDAPRLTRILQDMMRPEAAMRASELARIMSVEDGAAAAALLIAAA